MSVKDTWCYYPFDGISVDPTGKVMPCPCWSTHPGHTVMKMSQAKDMTANEVFNSKRMNEIRSTMLQGKKVDSCHHCYMNEKAGLKSKRQRKIVEELDTKKLTDEIALNHKPKLKMIELNFSNTCNLACSMCNRTHSSGWMQQEKTMPEFIKNELKRGYKWLGTPWDNFKPYVLSDKFVQSIIDNIHDYKFIMIKGGEPLYDKRCIAFLHKVAELNPAVRIVIVSNITTITPRMLETLSKLENLELNFSIDGVGKVYEWIRGFSWNKLHENFMKLITLSNVRSVDVNVSVSLWNVHILDQMVKHFSQFKPLSKKYFMSFHIVHEDWMNCSLADDTLKDYFKNTIKPELEQWTFENKKHMCIEKTDLKHIETMLYSKNTKYGSRPEMSKLACKWITWLNGIRKINLEEEVPHVKRLFNQYANLD